MFENAENGIEENAELAFWDISNIPTLDKPAVLER